MCVLLTKIWTPCVKKNALNLPPLKSGWVKKKNGWDILSARYGEVHSFINPVVGALLGSKRHGRFRNMKTWPNWVVFGPNRPFQILHGSVRSVCRIRPSSFSNVIDTLPLNLIYKP